MLKRLFDSSIKELKNSEKIADKVIALESKYRSYSDEDLKAKTIEFRELLANGKRLDDIIVDAFAVVREAAYRVTGELAYKVQIMGACVLQGGNIAEMRTGEGKTLTGVLTAYLNALPGKGVHIITVNEYLAARETEGSYGEVYKFLGLTLGLNIRALTKAEKREAYACDIMYSTNSEVGFDYLRDHMVIYKKDMVQRPLNFAIIDEVDSILVDEARTPLIISGGQKKTQSMYKQADMAVKTLRDDTDYEIDVKAKGIQLTDSGMSKIEKFFGIDNLYDLKFVSLLHRVNNALRANYIMAKDVDYVVQESQVIIVDQFTGRLMQGRQFSEGLHQALEAKENVEVKKETTTMATITYQNFFRMYKKLSGMTGTAKTEEEEFRNIYNMYVVEVPTNKPIIRKDMPDLLFATMEAKYKAIAKEIKERHVKGQPILVGTISIETSELLSRLLNKHGVKHDVLNAKQHEREADIILNAGRKGSVTIATNMAGRGTDIKLGEGVIELGGLAVIGTERHESRRIDNQLRGRSGRQGDPGYTRFYLSADDELMVRFGGDRFKMLVERLSGAGSEKPIESKMISKTVESAQKRIEGNNFDQRKTILQYDEVIRKQREVIYGQREELLISENVDDIVFGMIDNCITDIVYQYQGDSEFNYESLVKKVDGDLFVPNTLSLEDIDELGIDEVKDVLTDTVKEILTNKTSKFSKEVYNEFLKVVTLRVLDTYWTEHIDQMSALRQSIRLQAYAQVNPLREYQNIGFQMYNDLISNISRDVTKFILRAEVRSNLERKQVAKPTREISGKEDQSKRKPVTSKKVGRNEPCPCGSGRKYKQCCGK
ncbi:preprotein translocase subunit SecA [Mycoplasmatota bacterium]|nr:preprotein translocase subunit SecA [Mycoplasmatota bacterium]